MQLKYIGKYLLLCLVALQQLQFGFASRILAAFFFPGKSHFMMTDAIIRDLVKRGHEVTFITPFSLAKENLGPNYKELLIPQDDLWSIITTMSKKQTTLDMTDVPTLTFLNIVYSMGIHSTDFALQQPEVKKLINAEQKIGKYDLLLVEQCYNEAALMLGHLYQIPTITMSTFGYANYFSQMVGIIAPWSYVPSVNVPFTDRMSFVDRFSNALISGIDEVLRYFSYIPDQNALIRKHFSHLVAEVPTMQQLERNISVILLNNYMPLETPRPTSFNMISVGGLHIRPPKPLPPNLQKFLDEATHGVVYFSMGSQVRSADLPADKLRIFLNVFAKLEQRVLWKFEDEQLPSLPANVMVQKWMPQNDILAHSNVKVFIAHGGLFGTQEAVHYGVPVLGIPVFWDQYMNIKKGVSMEYALSLDYRSMTEEGLQRALNELLHNPKYRNNMKRVSAVFKDRPLSAIDTAIYWIEYVIEHRGAPHMIAAGLDLTWYQFYMLDVVAVALTIVLIPVLLLCWLLRKALTKTTAEKLKKF